MNPHCAGPADCFAHTGSVFRVTDGVYRQNPPVVRAQRADSEGKNEERWNRNKVKPAGARAGAGGEAANLHGAGPAVRQLPWETPVNRDGPPTSEPRYE